MSGYDDKQVQFMEETIPIVDAEDNVLRPGTKKECHLNTNIDQGMLHRAFSVFLFNSKNELLLQQRAAEKITFPNFWANSCCSHPLHTDEELEEHIGVKRAAIRKLEQELGISKDSFVPEDFTFMTKVHYQAKEEGIWGEHEMDHVLIVKKDIEVNPNPEEVQQIKYVDQQGLKRFIDEAQTNGDLVAPWFNLIQAQFLATWWPAVTQGTVQTLVEADKIYRLKF